MEAPPTTVDTAPVTGGVAPTRGRGGHMRGSYERGRGRGMGRGHFAVSGPGSFPGRGGFMPRGGMGGPPMTYPRGGYVPRGAPPMRGGPGVGGPGGYQGRGVPRGGPPMRGTGRMPIYTQPPKQHTGVDNNKTVTTVQANVANQVPAAAEDVATNSVKAAPITNSDPSSATTVASAAPIAAKPLLSGVSPNYRGSGRGRGISGPRGGMRGAYNPHNGSAGIASMYSGPQMVEHGVVRRGGPPRGRGQYTNTGMTRPPLMQQQPHVVNTQVTPQMSLKRGAPGGPTGPKRGRYEGGPYSQRAPAPKYHQPHMTSNASYGVQHQPAIPPPPQSHHSYAQHDPSQTIDPYGQSYAAPQTQTAYNGYGQTAAYSHVAPSHTSHPANNSYATHAATEYDQSQYQAYSSTYAPQDTRYQTYGQDYTQQYGAPAVDYSTSQPDYTQHAQQSYDERAYAGYDAQSYQQSYSNSTGYY